MTEEDFNRLKNTRHISTDFEIINTYTHTDSGIVIIEWANNNGYLAQVQFLQ